MDQPCSCGPTRSYLVLGFSGGFLIPGKDLLADITGCSRTRKPRYESLTMSAIKMFTKVTGLEEDGKELQPIVD